MSDFETYWRTQKTGTVSIGDRAIAKHAYEAAVKAEETKMQVSEEMDGYNYRWLCAYLISTRTEHDDAILGARNKAELDAVILNASVAECLAG